MLNSSDFERIEYQAINDYIDEVVRKRHYPSETIHGEIYKWRDADDSYPVPAVCKIPGEIIRGWIIDDFDNTISEFLRNSGNAQSLDEIAEESDLYDEQAYYDFVYDICDSVEDYFWESDLYQELCNQYFEDNAEEDYD